MKTKLKKAKKQQKQVVRKNKKAQPKNDLPCREDLLVGRKVVIATRRGQLITGRYKGFIRGDLYLTEVEITGTKYRVTTDLLFVPYNNLAHIHPEPETIEIIGGEKKC